jgi:hypothetical protein
VPTFDCGIIKNEILKDQVVAICKKCQQLVYLYVAHVFGHMSVSFNHKPQKNGYVSQVIKNKRAGRDKARVVKISYHLSQSVFYMFKASRPGEQPRDRLVGADLVTAGDPLIDCSH